MILSINLVYLLALSLLTAFVVWQKRSGGLLFIFAAVWMIAKTPFYFFGSEHSLQGIDLSIYTVENFLELTLLKFGFFFFACFSYLLIGSRHRTIGFDFQASRVLLALSLGLFFLIMFAYFSAIGGVANLWGNLIQRGEITRGNTFYIAILWSIATFIVSYISSFKANVQLATVALLAGCMFLVYGGRSFSIGLVVFWLACSYYCKGRLPLRMFSITFASILFLFLFVFILTPLLRQQDATDLYFSSFSTMLVAFQSNWMEIFERLAVPQIEFLVVDHFSSEVFWLGKSWLDLEYLFCSSSLCPLKPPLDDGVYLYNVFLSGSVKLGTPLVDLFASSYPFETWSIFYANFGVLGVFIGGAVYGLALALFSNLCWSRHLPNKLIAAVIAGYVAINFVHLSNLYFSIFLIPLCLTYFLIQVSCTFGLIRSKI